jgi:hypothetical protein
MSGAIHPLPQYASMSWCSAKIKHRGKFTFTFIYFKRETGIGVAKSYVVLDFGMSSLSGRRSLNTANM